MTYETDYIEAMVKASLQGQLLDSLTRACLERDKRRFGVDDGLHVDGQDMASSRSLSPLHVVNH